MQLTVCNKTIDLTIDKGAIKFMSLQVLKVIRQKRAKKKKG